MNFDAANNQDTGFIKLWNSLQKWEWIDDPNMLALWVHLLLKANWKDKTWKGHIIKRGQCVIGRKKLSQETGISEQTIKTCLNRLKSTSEITIKSTSKFSILTVVKYELYNKNDKDVTIKSTSNLTNDQPATNQQLTTTKEGLEGSEGSEGKINLMNNFECFWETYNYKKGRKPAIAAYFKAIKNGASHDDIIEGVKRYQTHIHTTGKQGFIMHATTFLNQERWTDEYQQPLNGGKYNGNSNQKQPSAVEIITAINDARMSQAEKDEADIAFGIEPTQYARH